MQRLLRMPNAIILHNNFGQTSIGVCPFCPIGAVYISKMFNEFYNGWQLLSSWGVRATSERSADIEAFKFALPSPWGVRAASAKLYNPYKHFLWCPTTRDCIIPFPKPKLQDVLVKLNDFAARFLIFTTDNLLLGVLFSEEFSLGYLKNNVFEFFWK